MRGGQLGPTILVVVALAVEAVTTWLSVEGGLSARQHWAVLGFAVAAFAVAAHAVRRLSTRWVPVAVLAGCVVLAAAALHTAPNSSDDWVRYAWDGRVQLHGIDPYRHAPDAPSLAFLRDGFLRGSRTCAVPDPRPACFLIDRAGVRTIYPPIAQAYFAAVAALGGGTARPLPFQLAGAVAVLAVAVVLLRRSATPAAAAVWAWCPLTVIQYVNNAHVDAVAVLLGVLGLTAVTTGSRRSRRAGPWRAVAAGAWIGAGTATKVFPVLLLPSLTGTRPVRAARTAAAAVAVVALSYLPHVLAVGPAVLGYLPGYLHEEGYADGERFHTLAWFVHGPSATTVAAVLLVLVAATVAVRADPAHPERTALVMVGAFLLVTTPTYPWYSGLLIAVAALADRPRWLVVAFAALPTYGAASLGTSIDIAGRLAYTAAAVVLLAIPAARFALAHARRGRPPRAAAATGAAATGTAVTGTAPTRTEDPG